MALHDLAPDEMSVTALDDVVPTQDMEVVPAEEDLEELLDRLSSQESVTQPPRQADAVSTQEVAELLREYAPQLDAADIAAMAEEAVTQLQYATATARMLPEGDPLRTRYMAMRDMLVEADFANMYTDESSSAAKWAALQQLLAFTDDMDGEMWAELSDRVARARGQVQSAEPAVEAWVRRAATG